MHHLTIICFLPLLVLLISIFNCNEKYQNNAFYWVVFTVCSEIAKAFFHNADLIGPKCRQYEASVNQIFSKKKFDLIKKTKTNSQRFKCMTCREAIMGGV